MISILFYSLFLIIGAVPIVYLSKKRFWQFLPFVLMGIYVLYELSRVLYVRQTFVSFLVTQSVFLCLFATLVGFLILFRDKLPVRTASAPLFFSLGILLFSLGFCYMYTVAFKENDYAALTIFLLLSFYYFIRGFFFVYRRARSKQFVLHVVDVYFMTFSTFLLCRELFLFII